MDGGEGPIGRGRRKLRFRRKLLADTAISNLLAMETLEPRVLLSGDLLPVHGTLNTPGQVDQYAINLQTTKDLYFDSLTPNGAQFDWTLNGPSGTVVSGRSFENSDSSGINGPAALHLPAGAYTLDVSGQNNTTGAYAFQLLDLANAAPVALGQTVDGTLSPADQTQLFQFTGTAGQTLFFDSHALDGHQTTWRVVGPNDTLVFGPNALGQDPVFNYM